MSACNFDMLLLVGKCKALTYFRFLWYNSLVNTELTWLHACAVAKKEQGPALLISVLSLLQHMYACMHHWITSHHSSGFNENENSDFSLPIIVFRQP